MDLSPPTLDAIAAARARLGEHVRRTPAWRWVPGVCPASFTEAGISATLKLELWQPAGSFKCRGALLHAWELDEAARTRGVTAVSAGNHAMAVAYAAAAVGTTAKVVMPRSADAFRVQQSQKLGAEVILVDDVHAAFAEVERIVASEGRSFIHPFEGYTPALGTATAGLEFIEDAPDLDAVIVPIGGGGLCAGISAAIKQAAPTCQVFGVEPVGADSMRRSLAAGSVQTLEAVQTIADSLGAPHAAPYSFALCQRFVDDVVTVDDDALCRAMVELFEGAKLAVEPAGAAATAALLGPLRERLRGKHVGLVVCGANTSAESFAKYLARGFASRN